MDDARRDIVEEGVVIPRDQQPLDGVLAYPLVGQPTRAALVVGPHPLMGGRLENNVVRGVGRGLAEHGWLTLRFEFTGAATSPEVMEAFWKTGRAPDDPQRADDAQAALDWFRQTAAAPLVLIGYSFGASLLAELVQAHVIGVVMIGATLAQHDYSALARLPVRKLVIAADNDFATPLETTRRWWHAAAEPKRLVVIPAAEHFYRGQEEEIVAEIVSWLPQ